VNELIVAVFGGLGSGLVVSAANFYFTSRFLDERLRKEQASRWKEGARAEKLRVITDLLAQFEDVRINYERIREGKPIDPKFEIRGSETIALTTTLRDLRIYRALMSETFYMLMSQRHQIAGDLAVGIRNEQTWKSAIERWEGNGKALRETVEKEFYEW